MIIEEFILYPYLIYAIFSLVVTTIFVGYSIVLYRRIKHKSLKYFIGFVLTIWLWFIVSSTRYIIGHFAYNPAQQPIIDFIARIGTSSVHLGVILLFIFIESLEREDLPILRSTIIALLYGVFISFTFNPDIYHAVVYDPVIKTYGGASPLWALSSLALVLTTGIFLLPTLIKQRNRVKDRPLLKSQINLVYTGTLIGLFLTPFFSFLGLTVGLGGIYPFYYSESIVLSIAIFLFILGIRKNPRVTYLTSTRVYGIYLMSEGGLLRYQYIFTEPKIRKEILTGFIDALHNFASFLWGRNIRVREIRMYGYTLLVDRRPQFTLILLVDRPTSALYESMRAIAKKIESIKDFDNYDFSKLDDFVKDQLYFA
ncbi:MAG: hypothetical protein J7L47_05075 [Candidatus Odinarchaeota archaeon]|nr:hypothetical protein [Candidatus Odinarchaeota archaeon]